MTIHVFYHYPCQDGIFSALAAWHHLTGSESVRYVGHSTYAPETEIADHLNSLKPEDTLYLIDYCGRPGFLSEACKKAKDVILLDHHKTAADIVSEMELAGTRPSNLETVIKMDKSGATIAWDYFSDLELEKQKTKRQKLDTLEVGKEEQEAEDPDLETLMKKFKLVEDYDLWRFSLDDSKAFNVGLTALNLQLDYNKNPGIFTTLLSLKIDDIVDAGKSLMEERDALIAELVKNKFEMTFSGFFQGERVYLYNCYGVETSNYKILNDLGAMLAEESKKAGLTPMGCVCHETGGQMKISLRSIDDFDTTVVSRDHGGGGHKGASGFTTSMETYQKMKQ